MAVNYFHSDVPIPFNGAESYVTGTEFLAVGRGSKWFHPIGDVVKALTQAGSTLDFLHEHDRIAPRALHFLEPAELGLWRMPEGRPGIPVSYSLSADKPIEKYKGNRAAEGFCRGYSPCPAGLEKLLYRLNDSLAARLEWSAPLQPQSDNYL